MSLPSLSQCLDRLRSGCLFVFVAVTFGLVAGCSDSPDTDAKGAADAQEQSPQKVVVYSARKEHLIKDVFKQFTEETGIEVSYITDKAQSLLARIQAEGVRTQADLFMTVDVGSLWQAAQAGVLQPLSSPILEKKVPAHLRDSNNLWFGLSLRARTMVYAKTRMRADELSTYEALGGPRFRNRLCLRTSKKVYNQSLVGTMIERLGAEQTQAVVKSWVKNLATPVFSNDTSAIKAVVAGQCDVTLVNSYYLGRLQAEDPDLPVALFWANQATSGTHVNISGAGMTKHAKNPQAAKQLLEWLVSDSAQQKFAWVNHEFPVVAGVPASDLVKAWGDFKADQVPVEIAGANQAAAIKIMDVAGYQ